MNSNSIRLGSLVLVLLSASFAGAADPPPATFECRFADGPMEIDGQANEGAWKQAQAIDHFTLPWLKEKERPAKTATRAKLLWDREYLYFFADMDDSDLYADIVEKDAQTWDNDVFELFFKPADDKPGYYEFQVNAANTQMDMFLPRRGAGGYGRFKKEGEFDIKSAVKLRGTLNKWQDEDQGWSVEGRIPWKSFLRTGGRPAVDEVWKFTLCRYDFSVAFEGPELSVCAPLKSLPYPNFHYFEDYAPLKFIGPKSAAGARKFGIEQLPPLKTSTVIGSPDPPLPYKTRRAFPKLELSYPVCVAHEPGSDRLIAMVQDRPYSDTRLIRFRDDPDTKTVEPLLETAAGGVAYSLTFHPRFAENGFLYVGWNGALNGGPKKSRVTRYTLARQSPFSLDPQSALEIISWDSDGHNGADMVFGLDGMMYVTSGDGTSDSDKNVTGQDLSKLLAKVLRIDVDHPDPGKTYRVPADNPFVGQPGIAPETWAYGFRNPWRITCDQKTGHIWVGNNGQDLWEQVYFVRPRDNFGWSVFEGGHPFYPQRKLGPHPRTPPAAEHPHSEARSLTGGVVYYGKSLPELKGCYLYGDHSTGRIWGIRHDGKQATWNQLLVDTVFNITCFAADSRGELLIADHQGNGKGGFYYLEPAPANAANGKFPRRLSETGLFASVAGHKMQPGVIPYSVNSPLWSDGAYKERYLAIPHKPGQDMRIGFTTWRGWNFPDETVLIKSFALEMQPGNAASRKWIETRLLTKQEGEWVGYSYLWNDEQTDATLVDAAGMDRDYTVGEGQQKWRYPSRTECMVCHSRAANYVLGLTEAQMNKDHDYGPVVDNQLRVLENLGLLKVDWRGEVIATLRDELKANGKAEQEINTLVESQTATRLQRETPPATLLSKPPQNYRKLADPYDGKAPLADRARSYLHANCAQCHVEAGGGNAQFDVEFSTELAKMKLLDVSPVHDQFKLPAARLISPGHPESSILLHRVARRGPGQMPQLATSRVDEQAVKLLEDWIKQLPPAQAAVKK